ncbi:MAG: hypothetical protein A2139_06110 [Desulfobacca sp. RBG_16_60_12]|nr:MAG: hypothetical protein A2139_06110 [Desulfobacca sp. RBG_16_60_12]
MAEKQNRFDKIIKLIRVFIWPLSFFILLFIFYGQISKTIMILADKIHQSNKITTSYFTIEVSEEARKEGKSMLIPAIEGLSSDAVTLLLQTSNGCFHLVGIATNDENYYIPINMKALKELINKGLLQLNMIPPSYDEINRRDFSKEPLDEILRNLSSKFKQPAIEELAKRGYNDIYIDLIKKDSLSILNYINSFPLIHSDKGNALLVNKKLSDDEANQLGSIFYQLTSSGKDTFYLIVRVVSQKFSKEP